MKAVTLNTANKDRQQTAKTRDTNTMNNGKTHITTSKPLIPKQNTMNDADKEASSLPEEQLPAPAAAAQDAPFLAKDEQAVAANTRNSIDSNDKQSSAKHNVNNDKKRKRGSYRRRTVPDDLKVPPEVELKVEIVKREQEAEEVANKAMEEAERQLAAAQKKVDDAKQSKEALSGRVEAARESVYCALMATPSPWKEDYDRLVAYQNEHGTCVVRGQTEDRRSLRAWTQKQRERQSLPDGNNGKLPWYFAHLLDKLGFRWKTTEDVWEQHYQDLVEYQKEFGHTRVPRGYKANPSLAHWVKRVRHDGNKFKENPTSVTISAAQIQKLDDIGFVWENLNRSWNERFEELLEFRQKHGHCATHKESNVSKKLLQWCQNTRAHHNAFLLGKKTTMTAERKKQLDDLGFPWELSTTPVKRRKFDENEEGDDKEGEQEDDTGRGYASPGESPPVCPVPAYQQNPYHRRPPHNFQG